MNILTKTQIDLDIQAIEAATNSFANAIDSAIVTLNIAYDALWKLPDDRLTAVLQKLWDSGKLIELFTNHNFSAVNLNEIKDKAHSFGTRAIAVAGREFTIDQNGIVTLIQPQIEE